MKRPNKSINLLRGALSTCEILDPGIFKFAFKVNHNTGIVCHTCGFYLQRPSSSAQNSQGNGYDELFHCPYTDSRPFFRDSLSWGVSETWRTLRLQYEAKASGEAFRSTYRRCDWAPEIEMSSDENDRFLSFQMPGPSARRSWRILYLFQMRGNLRNCKSFGACTMYNFRISCFIEPIVGAVPSCKIP
jgi:hypothetical protein